MMMGGLENASEQDLIAEMNKADIELAAAKKAVETIDKQHPDYGQASANFMRCFKEAMYAWERFDAYEPWHYLSAAEQDKFKELLLKL